VTKSSSSEERGGAVAPSSAQLFAVLWSELVSVLGTTAVATLVRRAAKRGSTRSAVLEQLQVAREGWEYRYTVPPVWESRPAAEAPELEDLIAELVPLLREFTGQIVIRRLGRIPQLTALGIPSEGP
jgi:uncharacterized membrane protein